MKIFGVVFILFQLSTTASFATNLDCTIDDSFENIHKTLKIATSSGNWNELYNSKKVRYRITEWWPNVKRPVQLILRIDTKGYSNIATGSSKDYVQVSIFDDLSNKSRTLQCHP